VRDRSEVTLVMPLPVPIPPSPQASEVLLGAFAERGIRWMPSTLVESLDPAKKVARLADGAELPYDLFLGVPRHRVPEVVEASGLCVDGWIPVDPHTLATAVPDVYAVGDVTSVGTPKAGVFAEGQASIVADAIIARHRAAEPTATYEGRGVCFLEFGDGEVGRVEVTFLAGTPPVGTLDGPSLEIAADKEEFGARRVRRWFAREWTNT
jgi:sulfide:quinone oxidoreductase